MLDLWLGDPTATYLKVVDTETGTFQGIFQTLANFIVVGFKQCW